MEASASPCYLGSVQEVYRINRLTGNAEKVVDPIPLKR